MAQTYIIVDLSNLFFRARHVIRGDLEDKIGMSVHTVLSCVRKAWRDFKGHHVVFCLEGRSWRKDVYKPYKANRAEARAALSPKEQEEEKIFWETFDEFKKFIRDKTNCTVLHNEQLEADDLIAGWIQSHPHDDHVIISTDSDFVQLVHSNVKQYNGVTGVTITDKGCTDEKGKNLSFVIKRDGKLGIGKPDSSFESPVDFQKWALFVKCMRGDTGDNVFSAYPGVREKGTKNKVGLAEAFADRDSKGWAWNNLMLQRWVDHNGEEHRVLEDYNRNRMLIDLTAQPDDVRQVMTTTINTEITKNKNITQVGVGLLKFCTTYDLQKISDHVQSYAEPLNAKYKQ